MLEADRLRIAMLLTQHVRVKAKRPTDEDYVGVGYEIEGIAEAADVLAKERDLLLRLIESAERHTQVAKHRAQSAPVGPHVHLSIAHKEISAAIALLRDGKVPAELMETAG